MKTFFIAACSCATGLALGATVFTQAPVDYSQDFKQLESSLQDTIDQRIATVEQQLNEKAENIHDSLNELNESVTKNNRKPHLSYSYDGTDQNTKDSLKKLMKMDLKNLPKADKDGYSTLPDGSRIKIVQSLKDIGGDPNLENLLGLIEKQSLTEEEIAQLPGRATPSKAVSVDTLDINWSNKTGDAYSSNIALSPIEDGEIVRQAEVKTYDENGQLLVQYNARTFKDEAGNIHVDGQGAQVKGPQRRSWSPDSFQITAQGEVSVSDDHYSSNIGNAHQPKEASF